ncbi:MAG: heavy-metal-associated domain-containing protein [Burkholderiales bacterium]|jgi:copper chaperone|nr:heavy-metal-associated domain-containing protein [Burkholderiales bacterium]
MSFTTVTFHIDGMTCQGCVASVTRALKVAPGVIEVTVSLDDKRATVRYDAAQTAPAALVAAVEDAGFDASTSLDISA